MLLELATNLVIELSEIKDSEQQVISDFDFGEIFNDFKEKLMVYHS
jgi:hypothetical protein